MFGLLKDDSGTLNTYLQSLSTTTNALRATTIVMAPNHGNLEPLLIILRL